MNAEFVVVRVETVGFVTGHQIRIACDYALKEATERDSFCSTTAHYVNGVYLAVQRVSKENHAH